MLCGFKTEGHMRLWHFIIPTTGLNASFSTSTTIVISVWTVYRIISGAMVCIGKFCLIDRVCQLVLEPGCIKLRLQKRLFCVGSIGVELAYHPAPSTLWLCMMPLRPHVLALDY